MSALPMTPICCDEKEDDSSHKSLWFQFVKSIATFKGDLSSVTAPPFLLAPYSILEFTTYWNESPSLFVAPSAEPDPAKRMLLVLKWFLSTLKHQHASKDETGKRKKMKPLNPFLGETFFGRWHDEAGSTELVAEQVSHHPPATAFRIRNKDHGVRLEGHIAPKASFSTTINIERKGYSVLHIDKYDEDHLITMPRVHVDGILTAQLAPELNGSSRIQSSSGYACLIDYSGKGWLRGRSNAFRATVFRTEDEHTPLFTLSGHWNSSYNIASSTGRQIETVDLASVRRTPLSVAPIEEQGPFESRRAWQHVIRGIRANDMSTVGREKTKIENAQRVLRTQEGAAGKVWKPRIFTASPVEPIVEGLAKRGKIDLKVDGESMAWRRNEEELAALRIYG